VKNLGSSANNTFGLVDEKTKDYITSRSAIGLTREGNFMVAVANSTSALELARTLKAAGACTAMQLDINHEWVLGGLFFHESGTIVGSEKFSGNLKYHPNRYIDGQPESRDFMYLVHDETNYKP
jgi:hypothetical protein